MNTQRSQIKKWDGTETTSWSNKSNLLPEKTKPQNKYWNSIQNIQTSYSSELERDEPYQTWKDYNFYTSQTFTSRLPSHSIQYQIFIHFQLFSIIEKIKKSSTSLHNME